MKKIISTIALGLALSPAVYAERPSFNYIEGGPTSMEHDTVDGDFKGFELTGSYELPDNFYIVARYLQTDDEVTDEQEVEISNKIIGIGYHQEIYTDTVFTLQLDAAEVTFGQPNAGEFVEKGFQWSVGVKSQITDSLEVELVGRVLDADQVDDEFGYYRPSFWVLGAHYKIVDDFSIYVDLESGSDSDRTVFGIRYDY